MLFMGCVISYFYIKPQRASTMSAQLSVVLYLTSTSNRNAENPVEHFYWLCYILLLHQTATVPFNESFGDLLCYILLLHQTATLEISLRKIV